MRAAFAEIVDYAGLFPPASCSMRDAVRQFHGYRQSADRWMLGRFVVAAERLHEFGAAIDDLAIAVTTRDPWRLSVVLSADVAADMTRLGAFRDAWRARGVHADSVECRVASADHLRTVAPQVAAEFHRYFEVPSSGPYDDLIKAIGTVGGFAKIRTGGTTPGLFPAAADLAAFLQAAVARHVAFKATAGLHHPFRGSYPLTYEPSSGRHLMYGFVNVLVATTELCRGGTAATAQAILQDDDRDAFTREDDAIGWRGARYPVAELAAAHRRCFVSFGSCSFREPVDELGLGMAA